MSHELPPSSPDHRQQVVQEEAAVERETLLEFPCRFPLKIMGPATLEFEQQIRGLVLTTLADRADTVWSVRPSAKGNFVGLTVTFTAQHRAELDSLYRAITAHPDVKMCL